MPAADNGYGRAVNWPASRRATVSNAKGDLDVQGDSAASAACCRHSFFIRRLAADEFGQRRGKDVLAGLPGGALGGDAGGDGVQLQVARRADGSAGTQPRDEVARLLGGGVGGDGAVGVAEGQA